MPSFHINFHLGHSGSIQRKANSNSKQSRGIGLWLQVLRGRFRPTQSPAPCPGGHPAFCSSCPRSWAIAGPDSAGGSQLHFPPYLDPGLFFAPPAPLGLNTQAPETKGAVEASAFMHSLLVFSFLFVSGPSFLLVLPWISKDSDYVYLACLRGCRRRGLQGIESASS